MKDNISLDVILNVPPVEEDKRKTISKFFAEKVKSLFAFKNDLSSVINFSAYQKPKYLLGIMKFVML